MTFLKQFSMAAHALKELGPGQLWHYALYRVMLRSGILRLRTRRERMVDDLDAYSFNNRILFMLPDPSEIITLIGSDSIQQLILQADQVVSGQVRLFGGELAPLSLEHSVPLLHWTAYESIDAPDPKPAWEAGRFGWGITLARAYYILKEERYAEAFWNYTERFLVANPPYLGLNWVSAQEVALRLIVWVLCLAALADSGHTTPERVNRLCRAIAANADRIPPTLSYARAQNNNHLLSEAVGLYTAGLALPDHPAASTWRKLGWRMANAALQSQINGDGGYVQHSTNYHRLVLQLAVWFQALVHKQGESLPGSTLQRLAAATTWLSRLVDRESGRVPNLGPNDGTYILPLTSCPFDDYRPVVQSASAAFLGHNEFPAGPWDELCLWLVAPNPRELHTTIISPTAYTNDVHQPYRLDNPASASWAYLRAATFTSRPGHADQLHLDLWWRSINLAQDAGTYLYNDPPPWDNVLSRSAAHNTLIVNGLDQMTRAGRFLWLDWAHARLVNFAQAEVGSLQQLTTKHNGYRRLGLAHQRTVRSDANGGWLITDEIYAIKSSAAMTSPITARLHWLLPDWPWQMEMLTNGCILRLSSPHGAIVIHLAQDPPGSMSVNRSVSLARAGDPLFGIETVPVTRGWVSPTYASKIPALSLAMEVQDAPPITLTTMWVFPD